MRTRQSCQQPPSFRRNIPVSLVVSRTNPIKGCYLQRRPFGLGLDLRARGARRSTDRAPYAEWETLNRPRRHPLAGAGSALLHVAAILIVLLAPRAQRENPIRPATPDRGDVRMMYVPPPDPPKSAVRPLRPRVPPPTPAFPEARRRTLPELPSPTEREVHAPEHDEPAASSPIAAKEAGASATRKETNTTEEDAMVSEARRLFGPPSSTPGATVAGPVRAGLPLSLMSGGPRCAWSGEESRPMERSKEGVIEGIVRTKSGGLPIPGAFLQMLGTGSATFADGAGHYRLTFDPSLVDACRSQLVRVTAPGYRARTMILTWGMPSGNIVDLASRQ